MDNITDNNGSSKNNVDITKLIKEHIILKSIIAGSASGLFSSVLFQPFDVVKTVLQDPLMKNNLSLINATKLVWKQEPFYGFWRGLSPSLARNIPGIAIHIPLTQLIYTYLKTHNENSMMKSGIAGFSARCITVTILMPFTVLKTRLESGLYNYTTLVNGLSNIYAFEGWRVMYRGWTSTILRDAPFSALYFMFFTQFKNTTLFEKLDKKQPFYIFGSGLLAGGLASCITQPFDVIKTSQQLSKDNILFLDAINLIKQKYGLAGYFRGLSLRILRRSLMVAITWTMFEQLS